MAGPGAISLLLKSPSLTALVFVQVSLVWQRLFEFGKATALPVKLQVFEAVRSVRLAAIEALHDSSWLGEDLTTATGADAAGLGDPVVDRSAPGKSWWEQMRPVQVNVKSRQGEDGILKHIFNHVPPKMKSFVELAGTIEAGGYSNVLHLIDTGWRGVRLTSRAGSDPTKFIHREVLHPHNAAQTLLKHAVSKEVDLMVVDLDSNDAHVLHALLKAGWRPRVIMAEANSNFGEESTLSFPPIYNYLTYSWSGCGQICYFKDENMQKRMVMCGVSLRGLARVADQADYVPVFLNVANLFLVRGDLLPPAIRRELTLERVVTNARAWNWTRFPFPRKECEQFLHGLVPAVIDAPPTTTAAPKPPAQPAPPQQAKPAPPAKGAPPPPAQQVKPPPVPPAQAKPPAQQAPAKATPPASTSPTSAGHAAESRWWMKLPARPQAVYTSGGEDGILAHIIGSIPVFANKQYVEFPSGDGSAAKSRLLRERSGWRGLMMDCCNSNPSIGLHKEQVTPESIVSLLVKHKVPREVDLLVVALQANDIFVLKSIFGQGYRPRLLAIKANRNFGDDSILTFPDKQVVKRSDSQCGPMCTYEDAGGKRKTVLCGAGVQGLFKLTLSAAYRPGFVSSDGFLFMVREDLVGITMAVEWTMPRVLQHARSVLGWASPVFPREACRPFMDGLVEVTELGQKGKDVNRWWERLPEKPRKIHSQNEEDGIIMHIFQNVKPANKEYFEFGSEDGKQTNTRLLRSMGWTGTNLDQGFEDPSINLYKEFVTPMNIASLCEKYKVRKDVDIFSIDVDSFDIHILRSVLVAGYRPRLFIVESNDNLGEDSVLTFPSHKVQFFDWDNKCGQTCTHVCADGSIKTSLCGASVRGITALAASAGYRPLYANRVNLFLVRGDTLPTEAAKNWTLEAVLRRSRTMGRRRLEFPREDCDRFGHDLVEVEPLPASAEAIPLEQILEVPLGDAARATATRPRSEPVEGSVTAFLKAAAAAAAAAKGGSSTSTTTTTTSPPTSIDAVAQAAPGATAGGDANANGTVEGANATETAKDNATETKEANATAAEEVNVTIVEDDATEAKEANATTTTKEANVTAAGEVDATVADGINATADGGPNATAAEEADAAAAAEANATAAEEGNSTAAAEASAKAAHEEANAAATDEANAIAADETNVAAAEEANTTVADDAIATAIEDGNATAAEDTNARFTEEANATVAEEANGTAAEEANATVAEEANGAAEEANVTVAEEANGTDAEEADATAAEEVGATAVGEASATDAKAVEATAVEQANATAAEECNATVAKDEANATTAEGDATATSAEEGNTTVAEEASAAAADEAAPAREEAAAASAAEASGGGPVEGSSQASGVAATAEGARGEASPAPPPPEEVTPRKKARRRRRRRRQSGGGEL